MKQQSKRIIAILGAASLILGVTGTVFAYGGYGPGWGGHRGMMGGPGVMMGGPGGMYGQGMGSQFMRGTGPLGITEQQLSGLKTELGITAEQEGAWNAYVAALQGRTELMQSHRQAMLATGPATPDQRLAFHQEGLDQMQRVTTARRDLFSTLTPQQQARADSLAGWNCGLR